MISHNLAQSKEGETIAHLEADGARTNPLYWKIFLSNDLWTFLCYQKYNNVIMIF